MHISGLTSSQVWLSSSRSLTNIGSGALAPADTLQTSLAANASVDLRTSAGIVGLGTFAVRTGTSPTQAMFVQLRDGTNNQSIASTAIATSAFAAITAVNTNSVGPLVFNNDPAVAGVYMVSQFLFTI